MFKSFLYFVIVFVCCALCKCTVFYPTNSEYGLFVALSIPVDLPHRNVFFSYNFEANYYYASNWWVPPILNDDTDDLDSLSSLASRKLNSNTCTNCTFENVALPFMNQTNLETEATMSTDLPTTLEPERKELPTTTTAKKPIQGEQVPSRVKRKLLSRTDFYHIMIDKLQRSGLRGEACLLRLICEVNASEVGDVNGVLGSLMRVIFTPSSSQNEYLPLSYYKAEMHGVHDQCEQYEEICEDSVLGMISSTVEEIFDDLAK